MTALETIRFVDRDVLVDLGPEPPFSDYGVPFRLFGLVEINETFAGTTVRWDPARVAPTTLARAIDAVARAPAPVRLNWFKAAWFSETHPTADQAAARMTDIARFEATDLLATTVTRPITDSPMHLRLGDLARDYSRFSDQIAISIVNDDAGLPVIHCGERSVMARLAGPGDGNPSDRWRAHETNRSYDAHMARQYEDMLATGEGRIDHIVAPVMTPDCPEPVWFAYRRIAVPVRHDGQHAVAVLCRPGPVGIEMLGWHGQD